LLQRLTLNPLKNQVLAVTCAVADTGDPWMADRCRKLGEHGRLVLERFREPSRVEPDHMARRHHYVVREPFCRLQPGR
jgi:hypothetical protein